MAFQKVEFEFPNDDDDKIEISPSSAEPLAKGGKEKEVEEDFELEIVDDTPQADRDRKPSDPPEDVTDDELENYSEKVRNRIKHFTKGYHDERRAKETAFREREELERVTKQLMGEINKLKETGNKSQTALIAQAKKNVDTEYAQARTKYKIAYEAGDSDAVLDAQEAMGNAKARLEKINNYQVKPLQSPERSVKDNSNESTQPQPAQTQTAAVDERAASWAKENTWFHTDTEMTGYALGLHNKLVSEGVDPKSDDYYETINSRMRKLFPERFEGEPDRQSRSPSVVAPATRSTAPKKIRLTQTQVRLAKRLGLTPEQYAKQVALDMRKNGNG